MDVPTFEELLAQIKYNLWLCGIVCNETKLQFRFYVILVALLIVVIEESLFLVSRCSPENFLELTQLTPCTCCGWLSILKIVPIAINRHKVFNLIHHLDSIYSAILTNPQNKAIVKKDIARVKILIKYLFILNTVLISVYNFATIVIMLYIYIKSNKVEFVLPYAVIVPFSTESWPTWFVVYLHSIICGFICVLFFTTVDALYCLLTSQICNHLSIISNEIRNLDKSNIDMLKELIVNHQYVLKLSEDLEDIFKLPNLFNVLVGSVEICALGFNLTVGKVARIPGNGLFLLSVLLQILMMSVFGEKLIRESRKIGDAAFHCNWYEMDEKTKKVILVIITRSQKPQQLTAYNFSVISYGSFTKIISTSWSYFTILRTVYTPPESKQLE